MIRTLFGASNTDYLSSKPSNNILFSQEEKEKQERSITHLKSLDPAIENILSPVYKFYYDGPMGGYGANIKARQAGYHIKSSEGLERVIELRHMNVPVISTPESFREFIRSSKNMTRTIAIIEHTSVMCDPSNQNDINYFQDDKSFYALVYEKRTHSDALYIYTPESTSIDLDYVKTYFRSKFFLFEPDKIRQSLKISGLYAIQDAKYLASNMKVEIEAPMFLRGMKHRFYLNKLFSYNEESLMQDHVITMIEALKNAALSREDNIIAL